MDAVLPPLDEPTELRAVTRRLLEDDPAAGRRLLEAGQWIAQPLWCAWHAILEPAGLDRPRFLGIVVGYQNELRLWVLSERTWTHCRDGLAGRMARRAPH